MTQRGEQGSELAGERLARFLAHAGIASRRHAEDLIAAGRVKVNGEVITAQGTRIDPEHDAVLVDGKAVQATHTHVYLLLHKPSGYVTTAHDPQGRPTVLDLLPSDIRALRVYPVGRLDRDTSGLLLLTNDGDFALRLSHPRYSLEKHYHALLNDCPTKDELEQLRNGVTFREDGGNLFTTSPARVRVLRREGRACWLELAIHEGRKRQIRRMLAAVGHTVSQLERVGIGPLLLGDLPLGQWRYLTEKEVQALNVGIDEG
ncbi:MAG TPA: pseudouridine synthase [Ktedonobacteraceae bacterium]|nr:pseudouridine synthase [Ktedonobacteraceae bacterium]